MINGGLMGILNNIVNIIKGYDFEEPVIVKESNEATKQVQEMTRFRDELNKLPVVGRQLIKCLKEFEIRV